MACDDASGFLGNSKKIVTWQYCHNVIHLKVYMQKIIDSIKNIVSAYNASFNDEERPVNAIRPSDDMIAIIATLCHEQMYNTDENSDDIIKYLETLENDFDDDFSFDFEGAEYRIIADSSIWNIYVEEIQILVEDCYDIKLDNIPHFVEFSIDWERTAKKKKKLLR